MNYDVTAAEYLEGYKIKLTFENGKSGVVDFQSYTERSGLFAKLADSDYFKAFTVNADIGTLTWNDELDVAPDTLYAKATGEPLPNWTETVPTETA